MLLKGPLYYTKYIIFEDGNDPPPLNNVKKTALFLHGGFPNASFFRIEIYATATDGEETFIWQ